MPGRKFEKGESVYGLWPGSGGLYFKGIVVDAEDEFGTYDVKFEEGTVYTLMEKHVKAADSFKIHEPKAAQSKRRGRSSSASRSRSRSRTPGRKPKSSSPILTKASKNEKVIKQKDKSEYKKKVKKGEKVADSKTNIEENKNEEITEEKSKEKKIEDKDEKEVSESKNQNEPEFPVSKPLVEDTDEISLSRRQPRASSRTEITLKVEDDGQGTRRRSSRIASKVEAVKMETILPAITEHHSNGTKELEASDSQDEKDKQKELKLMEPVVTENVLTSSLTSLLLISLAVFLHLNCQNQLCSLQNLSLPDGSQLLGLYNPIMFPILGGYYLMIILVSLLPLGSMFSDDNGILSHRRNAPLVAITLLTITIICKHYFHLSFAPIVDQLPQLLPPAIFFSLVLALGVFWVNKEKRRETGIFTTFIIGSTVDIPFVGQSIRIFLNRSSFTAIIILNYLVVEADYERKTVISPTLVLAASMQIIYALENLLDETNNVRTASVLRLKTGLALITEYMLHPFLILLIVTRNTSLREEMPLRYVSPIAILFLTGMFIKVASSHQKALFNLDPEHSSFSELDYLVNSSGQKLLITGWSGWLRYPESLGNIVVHWALASACGSFDVVPFMTTIVFTCILLERVFQEDRQSRIHHGPAWERYCQRVSYRIIPRIF